MMSVCVKKRDRHQKNERQNQRERRGAKVSERKRGRER